MKRTLLCLFFIFLLVGCGEVQTTEVNSLEAPKVDRRSPELKFVEDEMDNLIRSASSLVDVTWENIAESMDNYQFGTLSTESIISDLELAKDQYNYKITEIRSFDAPSELEFSAAATVHINNALETLAKAIQGKIDVIDYMMVVVESGEGISQQTIDDIEGKLVLPNGLIQLAAKEYGLALENVR
ncbi:hypothetical protein D3C74_159800 [compost metagenome]